MSFIYNGKTIIYNNQNYNFIIFNKIISNK